jgi:hypothetical protein
MVTIGAGQSAATRLPAAAMAARESFMGAEIEFRKRQGVLLKGSVSTTSRILQYTLVSRRRAAVCPQ